ncbi:uncharacterized protein LOC121827444 [Peromyscus maniculatus bairdii]|uniref:uncharacterized protein LOC121827444 n=1 Tax=Peromyscus maniculatus bairdii TaxID=230844 RepID=UPI003FD4F3AD
MTRAADDPRAGSGAAGPGPARPSSGPAPITDGAALTSPSPSLAPTPPPGRPGRRARGLRAEAGEAGRVRAAAVPVPAPLPSPPAPATAAAAAVAVRPSDASSHQDGRGGPCLQPRETPRRVTAHKQRARPALSAPPSSPLRVRERLKGAVVPLEGLRRGDLQIGVGSLGPYIAGVGPKLEGGVFCLRVQPGRAGGRSCGSRNKTAFRKQRRRAPYP